MDSKGHKSLPSTSPWLLGSVPEQKEGSDFTNIAVGQSITVFCRTIDVGSTNCQALYVRVPFCVCQA